jgi:hypothetical protein
MSACVISSKYHLPGVKLGWPARVAVLGALYVKCIMPKDIEHFEKMREGRTPGAKEGT